MNPNALALGCAQLGNDYGPAPVKDYGLARDIIHAAYEGGVRWFDTAASYGKSEEWLAKALDECGPASIITKVHFDQKTSLDRCHAVICHDGYMSIPGPQDARYRYSGVSTYEPWVALKQVELMKGESTYLRGSYFHEHPPGVLQVPANVFDRRMARAGVFEKAHAAGMTVFVRSVYLRGLTSGTHTDDLAGPRTRAYLRYSEYCRDTADVMRPHWHSYWYVRNMAPHAIPVIGAETVEQVQENIRIANLFDGWDSVYPDDDPAVWDLRGK